MIFLEAKPLARDQVPYQKKNKNKKQSCPIRDLVKKNLRDLAEAY